MNCTCNLYLHKCPPSLCPHCWSSLSLFWYVCLPFLLSFTTELILFLPSWYWTPLRAWMQPWEWFKKSKLLLQKELPFSQCFLLLPPQIPLSDGWENLPQSFSGGNQGLETKHFFWIWSRSHPVGYRWHRYFSAHFIFSLHNLTCCWRGFTANRLGFLA